MKKILVTGAAGFIGAQTSQELLSTGYLVVGVDSLNDYYSVVIKRLRISSLVKNENFTFFEIDIENKKSLDQLFNEHSFDAVINLAARAGVRYSLVNPFIYYSTNVGGTLNLLECMRAHSVKKLVMASTSSLYAGQKMPFTEDLPTSEPISPYAASKKSAETLAYTYHYQFGVDVTILRYFTVYGPASRPDMAIWSIVEGILRDKPITIYGDGKQARDFTYVSDIAHGTVLGLERLGYEIINLGGGNKPTEIIQVIEMIERMVGKKAILSFQPNHSADMENTWADVSKANSLLRWQPKVTLEEGLLKTVEWHQLLTPLNF
jgi:UDP-glucuronate 4-epimerase